MRRICVVLLALTTLVFSTHGSFASTRTALGYPVGWYDQVYSPGNFTRMTAEGANTTMPYGTGSGIGKYLTDAASQHKGVFVQIDPSYVAADNVQGVVSIVNKYKGYSAVKAWYLADEPTVANSMSAEVGQTLYNAIKAADPSHPVAIAFNASERSAPYANACDIMMWDYYPAAAGSPEFTALTGWRYYMSAAAARWKPDHNFIPVIQAFGATAGKYTQFRLPTANEERFMVYAALQTNVDGMFFWADYAADPTWRTNVFDPLMSQAKTIIPAVKAGPLAGVTSSLPEVTVTLYRDPTTGGYVLLGIHNKAGTVTTTVTLPSYAPASLRHFTATFGPYAVHTLEF
jgi:hypothetical protein